MRRRLYYPRLMYEDIEAHRNYTICWRTHNNYTAELGFEPGKSGFRICTLNALLQDYGNQQAFEKGAFIFSIKWSQSFLISRLTIESTMLPPSLLLTSFSHYPLLRGHLTYPKSTTFTGWQFQSGHRASHNDVFWAFQKAPYSCGAWIPLRT